MKKRNREINIFSVSFLDVLANTIGGLAFLLIFAVMLIGAIVFAPPKITTETLPDGYHNRKYLIWLGAREGLGKFVWTFGQGQRPHRLQLDSETGELSGIVELAPSDGDARRFEFAINCESRTEDTQGKPAVDTKRYRLTVHRQGPINTVPLRIMTDASLPAAYRQQSYPLAFAAEGGQAPYQWTGRLPAGLTLAPNGQISGAPLETGKFTFDVSVSTPQGESQNKAFALTVSENYPPPTPIPPLKVLTRKVPAAVADRDYEVQMAAEGGSPPYIWSAVRGLPAWLKITTEAKSFAGQPTLLDVGQQRVVWQVSDSHGRSARSDAIRLDVLPPVTAQPPPLRIKTQSLPDARVGQSYALALAIEGGFPPYTWADSESIPEPGLAFSTSDGVLGGVPQRAGQFPVAVSVSDRAGQKTAADLSLKIRPAALPVKILTKRASVGRVGQPYTLVMSAVGGYSPYHWRLLSGQLPPGLSLDENTGAVSGTPEQAGRWETQFTVADAEGQRAAEPLPIKLDVLTEKGVRPLLITTRSLPTLLSDQSSDVTLACEGGAPPYTWSATGALPDGLKLDQSRLVGAPTGAGRYAVEFVVSDSSGQRARAQFPLTVKRVASYWLAVLLALLLAAAMVAIFFLVRAYARRKIQPLRITTDSVPNARASFDYAVQLACVGGAPPYWWRVIDGELPPGMELSPDGKLFGCPFEGIGVEVTKIVEFTVEVRDQQNAMDRRRL